MNLLRKPKRALGQRVIPVSAERLRPIMKERIEYTQVDPDGPRVAGYPGGLLPESAGNKGGEARTCFRRGSSFLEMSV